MIPQNPSVQANRRSMAVPVLDRIGCRSKIVEVVQLVVAMSGEERARRLLRRQRPSDTDYPRAPALRQQLENLSLLSPSSFAGPSVIRESPCATSSLLHRFPWMQHFDFQKESRDSRTYACSASFSSRRAGPMRPIFATLPWSQMPLIQRRLPRQPLVCKRNTGQSIA